MKINNHCIVFPDSCHYSGAVCPPQRCVVTDIAFCFLPDTISPIKDVHSPLVVIVIVVVVIEDHPIQVIIVTERDVVVVVDVVVIIIVVQVMILLLLIQSQVVVFIIIHHHPLMNVRCVHYTIPLPLRVSIFHGCNKIVR